MYLNSRIPGTPLLQVMHGKLSESLWYCDTVIRIVFSLQTCKKTRALFLDSFDLYGILELEITKKNWKAMRMIIFIVEIITWARMDPNNVNVFNGNIQVGKFRLAEHFSLFTNLVPSWDVVLSNDHLQKHSYGSLPKSHEQTFLNTFALFISPNKS